MTTLTVPSFPLRLVPSAARTTGRVVVRAGATVSRVRPTSPQLAIALAAVLLAGIGLSIITTTDPLWWQLHFSELGIFNDFSSAVFNGTMIAAGLIIVLFALRVRSDLRAAARVGLKGPRGLFTLMTLGGVQLSVVGIVPVDTLTFIHDRAASGVMFCFAGLLATVFLRWHTLTAALRWTTGAVTGVLVLATPVFLMEWINLALFEAVGFALIFAWLGVFTTSLHNDARRAIAAH